MQAPALDPVTGLPPIPAMTSDAERECYYRLAREAAGKGQIIEFGAWLGASTAYIAAALRDAGVEQKAYVYDKFQSKKGHVKKVRTFYQKQGAERAGMPLGDAYPTFKRNMGGLLKHVEVTKCEIASVVWTGDPIALIVADAPKRVPQISTMMANFRSGVREGTVMAWQDFCHFPSYEIPACLYRLRHRLEFVEAVLPGSTLVFRVKEPWTGEEVSRKAFALDSWTPAEMAEAWLYWLKFVPEEKHALFRCGQAMFLCDIGHAQLGVETLNAVLDENDPQVAKKWAYLRQSRPDFFVRYRPLFDCFAEHERKAA